MSQKEELAKLAEKAGIAGYCNIPALMEYMEAAFLLGARARDRQLLESPANILRAERQWLHLLMENAKPEEVL